MPITAHEVCAAGCPCSGRPGRYHIGLTYADLDAAARGNAYRLRAGDTGIDPSFDLIVCGGAGPEEIAARWRADAGLIITRAHRAAAAACPYRLLVAPLMLPGVTPTVIVGIGCAAELALRDGMSITRALPAGMPAIRLVAAAGQARLRSRVVGGRPVRRVYDMR